MNCATLAETCWITLGANRHLGDHMKPIVIVGFGNTLRTDDGFGQIVAQQLRSVLGDYPAVIIHQYTQLLPEHTELFRDARMVLFIDADRLQPGAIHFHVLPSQHTPETPSLPLPHMMTAENLVRLAHAILPKPPRAYLLSAGGYSFDAGENLTDEMKQIVKRVVSEITIRLRRLLNRRT